MMDIVHLSFWIQNKRILHDVSCIFEKGKTYLLIGKNGSGKTSLCHFLMGNPQYSHIEGTVTIDGKDILPLTPQERARAWLFVSFQNVPEIPGVTLKEYLSTLYQEYLTYSKKTVFSPFIFEKKLLSLLSFLWLESSILERDLFVGFSGWEKRKMEILQAYLLEPSYLIFDEIDAWLDVITMKKLKEIVNHFVNKQACVVMISHNITILSYIHVDTVYILHNGTIEKTFVWNEITEDRIVSFYETLT